jgi:(1->4)-alpha-D-glucan 1-alpha-D-glucosylmutase
LLYQTLVGAWPLEPLEGEDDWRSFRERIENYMLKAIREAKQNTSWINQNIEYETAVSSFVKAVLNPAEQNRFMSDFVPFQHRVARIGLWNSLSQALLKLTCPGVPDIYQGNDLWDFSLVDPDNRRPVDYPRRQKAFQSIRRMSDTPDTASAAELVQTADDGRIKLYVVWKTLCLRKEYPELFQSGEYIPLEIQGGHADHAVAFIRRLEKTSVLVIVPRLVAGLLNESDIPPTGSAVWTDTSVVLPRCGCSVAYRNLFTGELLTSHKTGDKALIDMSNALAHFPVAFCLQS